ncbi:hypothetical protein AB1Y20_019400 [Prymnesium parvum]|uniref:Protein-serine/threonine phosphatase n=1 Tax=Prymnesium parvum TaxID=97485 RepID=A0AB34JUY4_PRYPA
MGANLSLDAKPPEIEALLTYEPSGPSTPSLHRSNLKVWRFFPTEQPLEIASAAVAPSTFTGFDAKECYVLLHIYRRHDSTSSSLASRAGAAAGAANGAASPTDGEYQPSVGASSELASSAEECLTPRGLSGPFSGYDDSGPYPFERPGDAIAEKLAHDIYIWNGSSALALTKAVALTKCFELERFMINDDSGTIAHLHSGLGGELLSASSLYSADLRSPHSNHLLSMLSTHADSPTIPCSSLLACMLPGLQENSGARFPELSKVLNAYLQAPQPSQPPPQPQKARPAAILPPAAAEPAACNSGTPSSVPNISLGGAHTTGAAMPKLGPGSMGRGNEGVGGVSKLGLNLAAVDMTQIAPNERELKAEKLAYFNGICSQITESIFLGSDTVARDLKLLQSYGITHVFNAAGTACGNYHEGTLEYKTLYLLDSEREDISTILYDAVEFIEQATAKGKVYVHCHQGVSRSSSMVIAYLMWTHNLSYSEAFQRVKDIRGVANPNAGFIARLIQFGHRIHNTKPSPKPSLYRLAPYYSRPIPRRVRTMQLLHSRVPCPPRIVPLIDGEPSAAQLDQRTCFVLHATERPALFLWVGPRAHASYRSAAQHWCAQLQKFQSAPPPQLEMAGSESAEFWALLGGQSSVGKLSKYDGDYGVGTTPILTPPVLPSLPPLEPLASARAAKGGDDTERAPRAPPDLSKLPRFDDPLPTPRGARPGADIPLATPRGGRPALEEPMQTPRGAPPSLPAPSRGRPSEAAPEPAPKKAKEGTRAELYCYPDWQQLASYSKDNLEEDGILALLVFDAEGTVAHIYLWVGSDSWLSCERDKEIYEVAREFVDAKGLPTDVEVTIAHETEEPDAFLKYFAS